MRKNIFLVAQMLTASAQFVESETQNDRKRHRQSDKLRPLTRIRLTCNCNVWIAVTIGLGMKKRKRRRGCQAGYVKRAYTREVPTLKSGRTQPLLTGFRDRGEAL